MGILRFEPSYFGFAFADREKTIFGLSDGTMTAKKKRGVARAFFR
jgi:hypothetical protein